MFRTHTGADHAVHLKDIRRPIIAHGVLSQKVDRSLRHKGIVFWQAFGHLFNELWHHNQPQPTQVLVATEAIAAANTKVCSISFYQSAEQTKSRIELMDKRIG